MFQGVRDVLKVRNGVLDGFKYLLSLFSDNVGDSDDNEHDPHHYNEHDPHHPNRDVDVLKVGDLFNCLPDIHDDE